MVDFDSQNKAVPKKTTRWLFLPWKIGLPPWKLTWRWKIPHVQQEIHLHSWWIFHCHVSFRGGKSTCHGQRKSSPKFRAEKIPKKTFETGWFTWKLIVSKFGISCSRGPGFKYQPFVSDSPWNRNYLKIEINNMAKFSFFSNGKWTHNV